jgi:hypothetical protein
LYRPYIDPNTSTSLPKGSPIEYFFHVSYNTWNNNIEFTDVEDLKFQEITLESRADNLRWDIIDWEYVSNKSIIYNKLTFKEFANLEFFASLETKNPTPPNWNLHETDPNSEASNILQLLKSANDSERQNIFKFVTGIEARLSLPFNTW